VNKIIEPPNFIGLTVDLK